MAVTVDKISIHKEKSAPLWFPVAASETIYAGTFCVINKSGLLQNATATTIKGAQMVVIPAESYIETTGVAGAISSTGTGARGIKCYVDGIFKLDAFTSITQVMVGQTMYISDNYTVDEAQLAGIKAGTLVGYYAATGGFLELNTFYQADGEVQVKVALTAAGDGTAGAVLSWANPTGKTIMVQNVIIDMTTAPTDTAAGLDVGVAANGTTSSDTLIDGVVLAAAGVFNAIKNAGTNGSCNRKVTSSQYITGTSVVGGHLDLAAFVGTAYIQYRIAE